jgi:two-component system, OmpR family, sensor histidine kinase KdpD
MRSRRSRLLLLAIAVGLAAGVVGLAVGVLASGGQPALLGAIVAVFAAVDFAVLAWRDDRRQQEADARQRLREDMVATVSHEMRTPLAPIKGWASTLLECGDRLDDAERRQALESILRHSRRLERLVVNLLEASRIQSGRVDAADAEVDAADVTRRIVDEFRAGFPDRQIDLQLDVDRPAVALGRELSIEQIVANLLSNAVKYAPPGQPIEVAVRTNGVEIDVSVTDHGPGIPPAHLDRVFDRFERLNQSDTIPGSGLGLYIARHLASQIGARVTVTTPVGGGSRFVLSLRPARQVVVVG